MADSPDTRLAYAIERAQGTPTAARLLRRIKDRLTLGAHWADVGDALAVAVVAVGDLVEGVHIPPPTSRDPLILLDALDDALTQRETVSRGLRNIVTETPSHTEGAQ